MILVATALCQTQILRWSLLKKQGHGWVRKAGVLFEVGLGLGPRNEKSTPQKQGFHQLCHGCFFVKGRRIEDRGPNLNPSGYIPAKPTTSTAHPTVAAQGWAIRHDGHFKLLGAAFFPADFVLRKSQEKLGRARHLMFLLTRIRSHAVTLLLLDFGFRWCQLSCHARFLPAAFLFIASRRRVTFGVASGASFTSHLTTTLLSAATRL